MDRRFSPPGHLSAQDNRSMRRSEGLRAVFFSVSCSLLQNKKDKSSAPSERTHKPGMAGKWNETASPADRKESAADFSFIWSWVAPGYLYCRLPVARMGWKLMYEQMKILKQKCCLVKWETRRVTGCSIHDQKIDNFVPSTIQKWYDIFRVQWILGSVQKEQIQLLKSNTYLYS